MTLDSGACIHTRMKLFVFKHTQRVCKDGRLPCAQTCSNGAARSHGSGLHCDVVRNMYIARFAAGIRAQESGNIKPDSWQARAMLEDPRHDYHVCKIGYSVMQ